MLSTVERMSRDDSARCSCSTAHQPAQSINVMLVMSIRTAVAPRSMRNAAATSRKLPLAASSSPQMDNTDPSAGQAPSKRPERAFSMSRGASGFRGPTVAGGGAHRNTDVELTVMAAHHRRRGVQIVWDVEDSAWVHSTGSFAHAGRANRPELSGRWALGKASGWRPWWHRDPASPIFGTHHPFPRRSAHGHGIKVPGPPPRRLAPGGLRTVPGPA